MLVLELEVTVCSQANWAPCHAAGSGQRGQHVCQSQWDEAEITIRYDSLSYTVANEYLLVKCAIAYGQ